MSGIKRDIRPLITTDEDQLDSLFLKNDKGDTSEGPQDVQRELAPDLRANQLEMRLPGGDRKKPGAFLQLGLGERDDREDDPALHRTNPLSQS